MTKREIIMAASKKSGIPQVVIQQCIAPVFESILDALSEEKKVTIRSFGTFYVKETKERIGRNPQTGEDIIVEPKKVIKFRATAQTEKQNR
ncbi:HU family DNA-binding protein [Dysgonomonas sp. 520]|uniref:HU family DNA-binding protein n=1 Tax=Dysgonomonas sp. 520 TaxID=2302931 RepID=UPI002103C05C|nr:HU family DNA-binding protein [Dysgonomonas sp. 520]NDW11056.1 HU family DNA-binding protein [Dysgonomonas sp. 520]